MDHEVLEILNKMKMKAGGLGQSLKKLSYNSVNDFKKGTVSKFEELIIIYKIVSVVFAIFGILGILFALNKNCKLSDVIFLFSLSLFFYFVLHICSLMYSLITKLVNPIIQSMQHWFFIYLGKKNKSVNRNSQAI